MQILCFCETDEKYIVFFSERRKERLLCVFLVVDKTERGCAFCVADKRETVCFFCEREENKLFL